MNVNELRIGNYVHGNPYDGVIRIFNNGKCVIKHKSGIEKFEIKNLQPIPLTEEWLLSFGFVYHHDTPHPNRVFRIHSDEMIFDLEEIKSYFFGGNFISVELKYVHQLQNLYFALTGKELIYKNNL
jgi:hypothetical protein